MFHLKDIAKLLQETANTDTVCTDLSALNESKPGTLSFILDPKHAAQVETAFASAYITCVPLSNHIPHIYVKNTRQALATILTWWQTQATVIPSQLSKTAIIHATCTIGDNCTIGENTRLYPNVTLYPNTHIGNNVIIHAGAVIGADGFGFYQHNGQHKKIPHIGSVHIEDDVEIGANTTIDRGCLGETRIGQGTKIDNLVQVGHNVKIGKHCIIVSQVGITGSATVGNYTMIGGQAGISPVTIGSRVTIAAKSGVTKDISDGQSVSGFPAQNHRQALKEQAKLNRFLKRGDL